MTTGIGIMLILIVTLVIISGVFVLLRERGDRLMKLQLSPGARQTKEPQANQARDFELKRPLNNPAVNADREKYLLNTIVGGLEVEVRSPSPAATEGQHQINRKTFDAFEDFVIQNFNLDYCTLQQLSGDKYVSGIFPVSNRYPDFQIKFKKDGIEDHFAVACKWRNSLYKKRINWSSQKQIDDYQAYAKDKNIRVFVIIGLGGRPWNPHTLFVVPLHVLTSPSVSHAEIERYKIENLQNFYWDASTKTLS